MPQKSIRTLVELAGMALDQPFEPSKVMVPSDIYIEEEKLHWSRTRCIFKSPRPTVLEQFRRLHEKPCQAVLKFVREFGVAFFCDHGLPISHGEYGVTYKCFPVGRDHHNWCTESLKDYRRYSLAADSVIKSAAMVNAGEVPEEYLFRQFAFNDLHDPLMPYLSKENKKSLENARNLIAEEVNQWISITETRPSLEWHSSSQTWHYTIRYSRLSVLGAVSLALLTAVSICPGWLMCSICSASYSPSRTPAPGRNHYCPSCRNSPEMWKLLKRQARAR